MTDSSYVWGPGNIPAFAGHHLLRYFQVVIFLIVHFFIVQRLQNRNVRDDLGRELTANPEDRIHPSVTAETGNAVYSELEGFFPRLCLLCCLYKQTLLNFFSSVYLTPGTD